MKAGKYSIKELFVNRYVHQIIIPEIQRDYVWEEKQVTGLFESIKKDYNKFKNAQIPNIDVEDSELKKSFDEFYKKRNYSSNIGFIYAYNDEQYSGKYFLIDGQQRITTIYLILLALANKNSILNDRFKSAYLIDGNLKLDYKVRESTHNFINEFVKQLLCEVTDIKNQNWYYTNLYDTDTSIQSWLNNFEIASKYINENFANELIEIYSYIENQVDFWYFDTNISEQGEELYIYMNARGEQMQINENLKADLLSKLHKTSEKNYYGKLWEDWQDFFWKYRGKNENADFGFNMFLNWCKILLSIEKRINDKTDLTTDEIELYADYIRGKRQSRLESFQISVEEIKEYFDIMTFYFEEYYENLKDNEIYGSLIEHKWLRSNINQIESFRLFPILYFIKKHELHKNKMFDFKELTKLNRFLYNLRQDETIGKTAATQVIYTIRFVDELNVDFLFDELLVFENKYKSLFNDDEVIKLITLNSIEDQSEKERIRIDFGLLEDFSLFKGKIGHIINVTNKINNDVFCIKVFSKLSLKYKKLLDNTQLLKSELIPTDSYTQVGNRIKLNEEWFKNKQMLDLLIKFYNYDDEINTFFNVNRKEFLSKYKDVEEIKCEENAKTQLYIYYLLSINETINWDLNKGKNFGIYAEYNNLYSIFNKHLFFQHYETQWHDADWRIVDIQRGQISESSLTNLLK